MTDAKTRGDMAGMLDGRVLNMANALRRVVGMWRQIKDIETRLSEHVEVTFVYVTRDMPASGLANVKKPILLLERNSNRDSAQYGQRTGFAETYAPSVFNKLDVEKAVGATVGNKYQILKDSRKERAAAKADKAGASTQEKGKQAIEGRVSSNNLLTVMSNIRVFVEDEDSKRHTNNRMTAMKNDDRAELISSILQMRDWSAEYDTPANRAIYREYAGTKEEKSRDELANKIAAEAAIKEAETQPTIGERLATEAKQFITTKDADKAGGTLRTSGPSTSDMLKTHDPIKAEPVVNRPKGNKRRAQ